ncbi:MAG: malonyl-CoA decarboxylase family protein, partial [Pseudomonadales bacterium]|nr:malonyl-CoA decarboxylase family protein [Pseudomonadales bacterium]
PTVDSSTANTAIFYSISNAQQGLAGISFGNFLIKRVVANLKRKLPNLNQFATLSPVPGFRRWLEKQMEDDDGNLLLESEQQLITDLAVKLSVEPTLAAILNEEGWPQASALSDVLYPPLMRLCSVYLTTRSEAKGGRMLDPVAHFHLSNGATLQQINWLGDSSKNGMKNAYGIMVNYLYNLDTIDENSENYSNGEPPSISNSVKKLVNQE